MKNYVNPEGFYDLMERARTRDVDYLAFCDQDDVWIDGKLSAAVEQIGKTDQPVLWCSDYQVTDSELHVMIPSALKQPVQDSMRTVFYNNVPGCTMVFNWALLQEMRKVNISEIRMHDIMAINVALITGKVIFDRTPYVLYRQHGNNVLGYSHKKIQIGKWIKEKLELVKNKEDYSTAEYAQAVLNAFESKMNELEKAVTAIPVMGSRYDALQESKIQK